MHTKSVKCPECTMQLPDDARFCGGCGYRYAEKAKIDDSFRPMSGDFEKALLHACKQKNLPIIFDSRIYNRSDFEKQGKALGLTAKEMAVSLHRISLEKVAWEEVSNEMKKALGYDIAVEEKKNLLRVGVLLPLFIFILCVGIGVSFLLKDRADLDSDQGAEISASQNLQTGEINAEELQSALTKVVELIRTCYLEALKSENLPSGNLLINFEVSTEAKVSKIKLDNLDFSSLGACIEESFAAVSMPRSQNAPMLVELPLELRSLGKKAEVEKTHN